MDTYLLIYLYIVLIYGTYLCLTIDNMQIPKEPNDDAVSSKVVSKSRLRGINDTNQKEENNTQPEKRRKLYTDDDFICDCNNYG